MPTTYRFAPQVREIGDRLIAEHHRHLLVNAVRVVYLFRSDVPMRVGKEVWGEAKKVTGLNAFLSGLPSPDEAPAAWEAMNENDAASFFVVLISEPIWGELLPEQKEALLDHELCHCFAEEDDAGSVKLTLLAHDLGEFTDVVRRHGLWRDDVKRFLAAARKHQPEFSFTEEGDGNESSEETDHPARNGDGVRVTIGYNGKEIALGNSLGEASDTLRKVARM